MEILLEAGTSANYGSLYSHEPPIVKAALRNDVTVVEMLLRHGANVNSICSHPFELYQTALMAAISTLNVEMVDMLLKAGALVNQRSNYEGLSLLHCSCLRSRKIKQQPQDY